MNDVTKNYIIRLMLGFAVIFWMIIVFVFSHQPGDESSQTSSKLSKEIATIEYTITL